jgi:hypothetical protein
MKPTGFHLLVFVVAGPLAAQEPAETAPDRKTSARLTQEIRVTLPKFTPPPPPVLDQPRNSGTEDDPNVLALPKFTVKEKRPPTHDPDVWLTDRAIQQKAMAAYENAKSLAEIKRVHDLLGRVSARDSKAAAELEQERVKMDQAEYWQSRPAGDGRKK